MILALLASQPEPKPVGAAHAEGGASVADGRSIVHASCETCHSLSAGENKVGPSLFGELNGQRPRATAVQVREIVRHGRKKMPA